MAEDFGHRLIAENERNTVTLDQLLASFRGNIIDAGHTASSSIDTTITLIPPLDRLINAWTSTRTTQVPPRHDAEADVASRSTNTTNAASMARRSAPIVEITGIGPSSGKTQLLYLSAARHLLGLSGIEDSANFASGQDRSAVDYDNEAGPPGAVVWIDLPKNFSALRLFEVLKSEATPLVCRSSDREAAADSLARSSLQHIHIFRPVSTTHFIDILSSLPVYLFAAPPTHESQHRPFRLLILSGISSFWWQDRHDGELAALGLMTPNASQYQAATDEPLSSISLLERARSSQLQDLEVSKPGQLADKNLYLTRWRDLVSALRRVQQEFQVPIFASNAGLSSPRQRGRAAGSLQGTVLSTEVQPHLPGSWNAAVTARLLIRRIRRKMPVAISAHEAYEDEVRRQLSRRQMGEVLGGQTEKEEPENLSHVAEDQQSLSIQSEDRLQQAGTGNNEDCSNTQSNTSRDQMLGKIDSANMFKKGDGNHDDESENVANENEHKPFVVPILESEIMINLWASGDWSHARWTAMEALRHQQCMLRIVRSSSSRNTIHVGMVHVTTGRHSREAAAES